MTYILSGRQNVLAIGLTANCKVGRSISPNGFCSDLKRRVQVVLFESASEINRINRNFELGGVYRNVRSKRYVR